MQPAHARNLHCVATHHWLYNDYIMCLLLACAQRNVPGTIAPSKNHRAIAQAGESARQACKLARYSKRASWQAGRQRQSSQPRTKYYLWSFTVCVFGFHSATSLQWKYVYMFPDLFILFQCKGPRTSSPWTWDQASVVYPKFGNRKLCYATLPHSGRMLIIDIGRYK
jgi:hypothetical protein